MNVVATRKGITPNWVLVSLLLAATTLGLMTREAPAQAQSGYEYTIILKRIVINDNAEGWGRGKSGEFRIFTSEGQSDGLNVLQFARKLRTGDYELNENLGTVWTAQPRITLYVRTGEDDGAGIDRWYKLTKENANCFTEKAVEINLEGGRDGFAVQFCAKRGGNTAWFEVHARPAGRPQGVWPRPEDRPPPPAPAPVPQLQWYYFKLTNPQSSIVPCYVTVVPATNADQAREIAQRQAMNYTVTPISAAEYFNPNTCRRK